MPILLSPTFFLLIVRLLPRPTLFPYTTLFRSITHRCIVSGKPMNSQEPCYGSLLRRLPRSLPAQLYLWMADRKSTRLNSSHVAISYAVFCLKKKNEVEIAWQMCTRVIDMCTGS